MSHGKISIKMIILNVIYRFNVVSIKILRAVFWKWKYQLSSLCGSAIEIPIDKRIFKKVNKIGGATFSISVLLQRYNIV